MPEFVLNHGSADAAAEFKALDAFAQGYVEAMFFTETGYPENGDLEHATVSDLHPDTLKSIRLDCTDFQSSNAAVLAVAYEMSDYEPIQAGRDYWFTRNGHGVGFWDRDMPEPTRDALAAAAHRACGSDLYRGDNGFLHLD